MVRPIRILIIAALGIALATLGICPAFAQSSSTGAEHGHAPAAPQGLRGQALKKACVGLAVALRSDGFAKVLTYLQTNSTKEAIRTITRNATTIAKTLDEVVKWEELSMAMVRGQVEGALHGAGVTKSAAAIAAYWIEQVLTSVVF